MDELIQLVAESFARHGIECQPSTRKLSNRSARPRLPFPQYFRTTITGKAKKQC